MNIRDDQGRRMNIMDLIVRGSIPVVFSLLGWVGATLAEHDTRLSLHDQYRLQQERDLQKVENHLGELKNGIPPDWFRKQVDDIAVNVKENGRSLADIQVRLARLEEK